MFDTRREKLQREAGRERSYREKLREREAGREKLKLLK